jgi:hypothetical protein
MVPLDGASSQRISTREGNGPLERCDQLEISFDDRPALRAEERLEIPAGDATLEVRVTESGGIGLRQSVGPRHEVTLCKAVPDAAGVDPSAVRPVVSGSSVGASGPQGSPWVGYFLVRSPRGSRVALSTRNGPVRADAFEGHLTVQTTNGPIALSQVRGTTTARAENGPIKMQGDGGRLSLVTQNGPIGVLLQGTRWQSGELEARAQNGPLSISVPAQYRSGVEIESTGHGPWSCSGVAGCGSREGDAGGRRVVLGEGPTQIRVSTVNGPVKVRSGDR